MSSTAPPPLSGAHFHLLFVTLISLRLVLLPLGGLKQRTADQMIKKKPTEVLRKAVLGMLARTNLRHKYIEPRLRIYAGPTHPHTAQLPPSVTPLPPVPRNLSSNFHFGLGQKAYAHPDVAQQGIASNMP